MEKRIENLAGLEQEAVEFVAELKSQERATLVTLSGELGAGKTTFSQAIARALGVTDTVTSPTFVLEKIYQLPKSALFKRLIHIDAYRLQDGAELEALAFTDFMSNPENIILLEWPERVASVLPAPTVSISLLVNEDNSRTLIYA